VQWLLVFALRDRVLTVVVIAAVSIGLAGASTGAASQVVTTVVST